MINVWGDSVGAGVVAQLSRRKLAEADHQHDVTGGGGSTLDVNGALLNGKVTIENGGKVTENGGKVTENGGNIYPDLKQTGALNHGYDYTHM